jgi:signal transduction histidine kinase
VIAPSARGDEIGVAERALAQMELALADQLRQKRRLAELGLAVSKINHELRNMLTTAQLLGDRLESASDPAVQRIAPRLAATLSRAIAFCQATLAYGRAVEPRPQRRLFALGPLAAELTDLAGPDAEAMVSVEVPPELIVDADPEQLGRVLVNLVRNALQALAQAGPTEGAPSVRVQAWREQNAVVIRVSDNGPGVPERARAHLFEAFQGSARPGGTGLGLAISAELVQMHGGMLTLVDVPMGACFQLTIPDRTG